MDLIRYQLPNETNLVIYQSGEETSHGNSLYGLLIGLIFMLFLGDSCNNKTNNIAWNKILIQLLNTINLNILFGLFLLILTIILLPILLLLLGSFYFYNSLIVLILKFRHGKDFGLMLKGVDSIWAIEDNSKSIINILLIVETPNLDYFKIRDDLDKKIFQKPVKFEKLLSTFHNFGGYYYTLRNQVKIHDVIKPLNCPKNINKNDLITILEKYANCNLPKNHKCFWEVLIGSQSISWGKETKIPIIFRIHHGLIDGISLLKVLVGILADSNQVKNVEEMINVKNLNLQLKRPKINVNFLRNLYTTCIVPAVIFLELIMRKQDYNIVHGTPLSGEKFLFFKTEEEPNLIEKIKQVKNRLGVKFSEVIYTAISASFHEYFRKNSIQTPEIITAVIPSLKSNEFRNFEDEPIFQNRFEVAMLNIPIMVPIESNFRLKTPLINRLRVVSKQVKILRNSIDYQVNSWLLTISTILPDSLLRLVLNSTHSSLIISNLPGPKEMTVFGGMKLKNVLFWIPHRGTTGLGLSLLSYNNCLQVGLSADKSLIFSQKEGQDIIENIFKYLNDFHIEIQ